jgi:hypothetical protein
MNMPIASATVAMAPTAANQALFWDRQSIVYVL